VHIDTTLQGGNGPITLDFSELDILAPSFHRHSSHGAHARAAR
jgi:hypothetical protein